MPLDPCKIAGFRFWVLLPCLFWLVGCSATTTFSPYTQKIAPFRNQLSSGNIKKAPEAIFKSERSGNDGILYNLETARILQINRNFVESRKDYAAAIAAVREKDNRATISASAIGAGAASLLTNDNAIPYVGEGYEHVFMHHYQALNYLLEHNLEDAGVEFRWANSEQDEALQRHERELERAQREAEKNRVKNRNYARSYAQLDEEVGSVKNSFQNAYSFFLSGLVYELQGDLNDAYIDYKKALEIQPQNRYLQQDVVRLARQLSMSEELTELTERFSDVLAEEPPLGGGELIVIFEDGLVPQRQPVEVMLPLPTGSIAKLALPTYPRAAQVSPGLKVEAEREENGDDEERVIGRTQLLCNVRTLAVKSLLERMPVIVTRQLVRLTAKAVAAKQAKDQLGPLGQICMDVYNIVSEQADLRSWSTLPASAQVLRTSLAPGTYELELSAPGSDAEAEVEVEIGENRKTLLYVVRVGQHVYSTSVVY